ncbi:MAG: sn-glycerol-1-phosphate dehydrogenase [Clostridiales bacterium]|nr:sn-glycerol-1-phosphate dehydrogenase [Clostridiales bacterium]
MGATIRYDADSRLTISGIQCDCGLTHNLPTQDIYVGQGLLPRVPAYIRARGLGTHCVLVADQNTWPLAGERVEKALLDDGFTVVRCVIRRDGVMDPDERACGEVLLSIQPETEFLVAVGSGSITDTTRVNATRCKLPFVSVGTAPSMDGYTSVVAPLLLRGVKIHRTGYCPEIIVCDTDILSTAPLAMVQSGVGDVLGKYIAKADWMLGSIINGEVYCDVCGEIVTEAVQKLLANIGEIRARTEKGIRILIEALLLAGVTIMIVGHTRAVASVEHNIAHYWEMMQLLHGRHAPAHGASVGVATLLCWPLFTRFASEDLSRLDLDRIKARRLTRAQREAWMLTAFEDEAGHAIMRDNPGDFLTWEEQERRIRTAQARQEEIRRVIGMLPPYETILCAMRELGAPTTAAEMGVDAGLLNLSMHCAKDYRTRYTLFKLIDECGLEEAYLRAYPL